MATLCSASRSYMKYVELHLVATSWIRLALLKSLGLRKHVCIPPGLDKCILILQKQAGTLSSRHVTRRSIWKDKVCIQIRIFARQNNIWVLDYNEYPDNWDIRFSINYYTCAIYLRSTEKFHKSCHNGGRRFYEWTFLKKAVLHSPLSHGMVNLHWNLD